MKFTILLSLFFVDFVRIADTTPWVIVVIAVCLVTTVMLLAEASTTVRNVPVLSLNNPTSKLPFCILLASKISNVQRK